MTALPRARVFNQTAAAMRIVLASSSPYRRQLLERLGIPFEVASPNVDETPGPAEAPRDLVLRLANAKADAVAAGRHPSIVVASDQVAVEGARTLGKPGTHERAVALLASLSGRTVSFLTSLLVLNTQTGNRQGYVDETRVHFRDLATEEIERYVASEQPLDCAGGIKSEGQGILLCRELVTRDPTALIGLPLIELGRMLRTEGVAFFRN